MSSTQEIGEGQPKIVNKAFRMGAFGITNLPIMAGMLLYQPTMASTILFQWLNQSYVAGLNYCNKNPNSTFTQDDITKAYTGAVITSLSLAMSLRMMTKGLLNSSTGAKFIIFNTCIACVANSSANYINTSIIRHPESVSGIKVFKSDKMKDEDFLGYS